MLKYLLYGIAMMISIISIVYLSILAIVPAAFIALFISKELEV